MQARTLRYNRRSRDGGGRWRRRAALGGREGAGAQLSVLGMTVDRCQTSGVRMRLENVYMAVNALPWLRWQV